MDKPFEATGGAKVGLVTQSWPLAKLTATPDAITLTVRMFGEYTFPPGRILALSRREKFRFFGRGLEIRHDIADYPERIIFLCWGSPDKLLAGIRDAGFAAGTDVPPPRSAGAGWAIRWQTVLVSLLVWNVLFLLDLRPDREWHFPGTFSVVAVGLLFVVASSALRFPFVQRWILKPGRSVGEILPLLKLLRLVAGLMIGFFILLVVAR